MTLVKRNQHNCTAIILFMLYDLGVTSLNKPYLKASEDVVIVNSFLIHQFVMRMTDLL